MITNTEEVGNWVNIDGETTQKLVKAVSLQHYFNCCLTRSRFENLTVKGLTNNHNCKNLGRKNYTNNQNLKYVSTSVSLCNRAASNMHWNFPS